ncbi:MAG TPA: arginine deiminase family protein [Myxococcota bacterium]
MHFEYAIARAPGENFAEGLTSAALGPADLALMRAQHRAYVEALRGAGLEVQVLDAALRHPDAHFVEDVAVVTPEVAVIARPAEPSRRGEEALMEPVLAAHRALARIEAPGTLEGGDVLQMGKCFFIGVTARTNEAGARQLERILSAHGYRCALIPVTHTLHLKSDVNAVSEEAVVVTPALAEHEALAGYERIAVHPEEAYAANVLRVNERLLMPRGFPRLRERLAALDVELVELDMSEARKMDGGLTCLSLRF